MRGFTTDKERRMMDLKRRLLKKEPRNLLVICGPPCSGKKEDKFLYTIKETEINVNAIDKGFGLKGNVNKTGVLFEEAQEIRSQLKIGLIETTLEGAKQIHEAQKIPCNYIYVQPPNIDQLAVRLIRNRAGQDNQNTMLLKQNKFKAEMAQLKNLNFINKVIINNTEEEFMKEAGVYVVFDLYKLKK
eukprot:403336390